MSNQHTQTYRYQCKLCNSVLQPLSGLSRCTCGAVGVDVLDPALGTIRLLGKPEDVIDLCEQINVATGKSTKD